ncbi:hypothetical protein V6N12_041635 [Hibiscus sabdariffa]|uniref:ClpA/ClpB AAA lid domain-containing protein n=1 Tax=Hibiscus sabdariffa TaxID=183260 RepID=A0ABR2AZF0_9ROSI
MVALLIAKDDFKFTKMGIVLDGRVRLGEGNEEKASLMGSYFGNVHDFLEQAVTKEHFLGLIDWVKAHRPEPALAKIYNNGSEEGPTFVVVIRMVGQGNECTGATTLDGCTERIEEDPALARPIKVPEPSVHEAMQTLREHYKICHKLRYKWTAVTAAVVLSDLYIRDHFLPDKAIDLFDKAGARVSTRHAELLEVVREFRRELRQIVKSKKEAGRSLDSDKFRELHNREMKLRGIVSSWTCIAIEKLVNYKSTMLRKMDKALHKGVIGQDEAVKAVSRCACDSPF